MINIDEFIELELQYQNKVMHETLLSIFDKYKSTMIELYNKSFKKDIIEFQIQAAKWLDLNTLNTSLSEKNNELKYMTEYYKSNCDFIKNIISESLSDLSAQKICKNKIYPILKFAKSIVNRKSINDKFIYNIIINELLNQLKNIVSSINKKIKKLNITPEFVLSNNIKELESIHKKYLDTIEEITNSTN